MSQALVPRRAALQRLALWTAAAAGAISLLPQARAESYEVSRWPPGLAVPPLQATDLQGKVWRLADLRDRAVLLNFWATWCEPCRAEMPTLQQLAEIYGPDKLVVLAVNFREGSRKIRQYVQSTGMNLPVLLDPTGEIARQWGASVFPTTILIDSDGKPLQRVRGQVDWTGRDAEKMIDPLFKRGADATMAARRSAQTAGPAPD